MSIVEAAEESNKEHYIGLLHICRHLCFFTKLVRNISTFHCFIHFVVFECFVASTGIQMLMGNSQNVEVLVSITPESECITDIYISVFSRLYTIVWKENNQTKITSHSIRSLFNAYILSPVYAYTYPVCCCRHCHVVATGFYILLHTPPKRMLKCMQTLLNG